jgi:H+/gluconate symporter-like permease
LVPLARSFYKRTGKNYLLCILAIAAGGAVTHTLVPPTPGPLVMAAQLGVDLGMMIVMGAIVALPAAVAGMAYAKYLDRRMIIVPAESSDPAGQVVFKDEELPRLWISLLPVLLPVILIACHTGADSMVKRLAPDQDKQLVALQAETGGLNKALGELKKYQDQLPEDQRASSPLKAREETLQAELKTVQEETARVKGELSEKAGAWYTAMRYTAVLGNPNFALLLSAAIAILLYVKQRKPTLTEFSNVVEVALMSAGVIILITAAGVAFGEMLKAAKIGDAIRAMFGKGEGVVLLTLGFGLAALLKIAQGSSTAAMIIGSSMMASIIQGSPPPFHVVYLATAIGGGSLVGSWMNDSGFWIFAKMGGLTETEALKSWTPMLVILGFNAYLVSILLVLVMPNAF